MKVTPESEITWLPPLKSKTLFQPAPAALSTFLFGLKFVIGFPVPERKGVAGTVPLKLNS